MRPALTVLAGAQALRVLRQRGLRGEDVDVVVGASGGPKWLVLAALDRALFGELQAAPRARPLHLVGSSVGSWRMACLAQTEAVAALARAHEAYLAQEYSRRPSPEEVTTKVGAMLDSLLGAAGEEEILGHPWARLHVLTSQFRGLLASQSRAGLALGLALAGLGNAVARPSLAFSMQRVIFHAGTVSAFAGIADFPTLHVPLNRANLKPALLASASLPLVMNGVRIPGETGPVHMDGGFIDYHPDFDFGQGSGLVLYPHYFPHVVPGWFDKVLPWRRSNYRNFSRAVLLAPSREFVRSLPYRKIPDRDDFARFADTQRRNYWRQVMAASRQLADEFLELQATGRLAERAQAL